MSRRVDPLRPHPLAPDRFVQLGPVERRGLLVIVVDAYADDLGRGGAERPG